MPDQHFAPIRLQLRTNQEAGFRYAIIVSDLPEYPMQRMIGTIDLTLDKKWQVKWNEMMGEILVEITNEILGKYGEVAGIAYLKPGENPDNQTPVDPLNKIKPTDPSQN